VRNSSSAVVFGPKSPDERPLNAYPITGNAPCARCAHVPRTATLGRHATTFVGAFRGILRSCGALLERAKNFGVGLPPLMTTTTTRHCGSAAPAFLTTSIVGHMPATTTTFGDHFMHASSTVSLSATRPASSAQVRIDSLRPFLSGCPRSRWIEELIWLVVSPPCNSPLHQSRVCSMCIFTAALHSRVGFQAVRATATQRVCGGADCA
jgi:hypothetical protein